VVGETFGFSAAMLDGRRLWVGGGPVVFGNKGDVGRKDASEDRVSLLVLASVWPLDLGARSGLCGSGR